MKKWRFPLPRLSRRGKIIRNLLLCLPLAVLAWAGSGCPMPTLELEFRRVERQYLLSPAQEILWDTGAEGWSQESEGDRASWRLNGHWVVGAEGEALRTVWIYGDVSELECYPLEQAPFPVPLPDSALFYYRYGISRVAVPLAFFGAPEGTARARLELEAVGRDGEGRSWSGEGYDLGEGRWIFPTEPDSIFPGGWYMGGDYVLRLYDEAGELLLEKEGVLPCPL